MSKSTKYFELFSALRAGGDKGVTPEALRKATGFNEGALAVYIHALRHKFGAVIESVRNGRSIVAYRLTNADQVNITAARKPRSTTKVVTKTPKTKTAKKSKVAVARVVKTTKKATNNEGIVDVSDLEIQEYNDADLADIRQSLGI